MENRTVIVLVGYPGCGKTTFAKHYYPDYIRLDGDSLKTPQKVVKALGTALDTSDKGIVVDATNMSLERRKPIIEECRKRHRINVACVFFQTPMETCMQRSKQREEISMANGQEPKHIPRIAYHKLKSTHVIPLEVEGFDFVGITQ